MVSKGDGPDWVPMYLVGLLLIAFLVVIGAAGNQLERDLEQQGPALGMRGTGEGAR